MRSSFFCNREFTLLVVLSIHAVFPAFCTSRNPIHLGPFDSPHGFNPAKTRAASHRDASAFLLLAHFSRHQPVDGS